MAEFFFKKYGHQVLDNGYEVVPITPGTKFPNFNTWRSLERITHKRVNTWQSNGHAKDGLGIRAKHTPMLDIDCQWKPVLKKVVRFAENLIGFAPRRIGAAPKVGLIFRSAAPFKKVQSKAFTDPDGNKALVEFLGDGQQWVALHIHPDTKKPYKWPDAGYNVVDTPREDLPSVTAEQALAVINYFEKLCLRLGWSRWKSKAKSTALTTVTARDPDDITGSVALGISIDEVRDWIERLPNDDSVEYEDNFNLNPEAPNYRNVIFAIWHETEGSDEGKEIALEWSERSEKHEEEVGRFEKLWNSADPEDHDSPVTFRYVIGCILTIERNERREQRDGFIDSMRACTDADDLESITNAIRKVAFSEMERERLAQELKTAFRRITSFTLSIEKARKQIIHTPLADELPPWIKPWVYLQHTMRFYNRDSGLELDYKAFDASFSRYLGGASAIDFALKTAQIKPFWMQMYKPGDDEEFWFEGHPCINSYSDRLAPVMPDKYSKADLIAIETVEAHFRHVLPNKRERAIFLSFLAYIVKTQQRPNWATVLQGVDGDGKSFFGALMGAILGSKNVRMLDAQQLEDRYTGWAVGQLFCFIEELRLQGHSRYDILNKIKPYITNEAINVHPKNINPYTALNTTAYMATTNFRDALPVNDNDRRWFVLYSKWQTGDQLRGFLTENPDYFNILWATLARAGALRKWLNEYEPHEEFEPKGRAPMTRAKADMVSLSKSDAQTALEEIIAENTHPRLSSDLIVTGALTAFLYDNVEESVSTRSMSSLLSSLGYVKLPHKVYLGSEANTKESVWVRDRKRFETKDAAGQRQKVSSFLRVRQGLINHENEI